MEFMSKPINHYDSEPDVNLTPEIRAADVIPPGTDGGRLSVHKIWIPANTEYPPHQHPSPHIVVILEGGGYMKYGEGKDEVSSLIKAGDVFHVPDYVRHQVGADARGMVMMAISVDSKTLTDPDRLQVLP